MTAAYLAESDVEISGGAGRLGLANSDIFPELRFFECKKQLYACSTYYFGFFHIHIRSHLFFHVVFVGFWDDFRHYVLCS